MGKYLRAWMVAGMLFHLGSLLAQSTKGADVIPSNENKKGETWALIIGISDYQDSKISDLQFAHRDAEAFRDYLVSQAPQKTQDEKVLLLQNEQATTAAIYTGLDWLLENVQAGDQAIIYLSGHGDVETKTISQNGFFLAHDTPSKVYAAGALRVSDLQDYMNTLSSKDCQVVMIADACRSGQLAGNQVQGKQASAISMGKIYSNEIKIMSCQPDELSLEGKEWGGGRGLFSFHLLEGLVGLADQNHDLQVNLLELGRYLEDQVTADAAPNLQTPMVVGNRQTLLAKVDSNLLNLLVKQKKLEFNDLAISRTKTGAPVSSDSISKILLENYDLALREKRMLGADGAIALFYQLDQKAIFEKQSNAVRRNLAVTLIDEVQQALNALLLSDPYESNNWLYNPKKYKDYPVFLENAIQLLGENHRLKNSLEAKKLYLEAYLLARSLTEEHFLANQENQILSNAKSKLHRAIQLDSTAAYLYFAFADLYHQKGSVYTDSLVYYCERALEFSPTWLLPCLLASFEYSITKNDLPNSKIWLDRAYHLDSTSYLVLERLAWYYQWVSDLDASFIYCEKMMSQRPELFNGYATAGVTAQLAHQQWKSIHYFEKALQKYPKIPENWSCYILPRSLINAGQVERGLNLNLSYLSSDSLELSVTSNILYHTLSGLRWINHDQKEKLIGAYEEKISNPIYKSFITLLSAISDFGNGNLESAQSKLQDAVTMVPDEGPILTCALLYHAKIQAKKGQYAQADSLFRESLIPNEKIRGIEDLAEHIFSETHLEYSLFLMDQKRWKEAKQILEILIRERPFCYFGYYGMATWHACKKQNKKALKYLGEAVTRYYPLGQSVFWHPSLDKLLKKQRNRDFLEGRRPKGDS